MSAEEHRVRLEQNEKLSEAAIRSAKRTVKETTEAAIQSARTAEKARRELAHDSNGNGRKRQ